MRDDLTLALKHVIVVRKALGAGLIGKIVL